MSTVLEQRLKPCYKSIRPFSLDLRRNSDARIILKRVMQRFLGMSGSLITDYEPLRKYSYSNFTCENNEEVPIINGEFGESKSWGFYFSPYRPEVVGILNRADVENVDFLYLGGLIDFHKIIKTFLLSYNVVRGIFVPIIDNGIIISSHQILA
jgi:hypothetical protein